MRLTSLLTAIAALFASATSALAQAVPADLPILGRPEQGGVNFQTPATDGMRDIIWLDGMLLIIITAISVFVLALIVLIILRFNSRSNPEPATFTHNTPIEVAWTVIPIVVLVFIGAFSLPVLFKQQKIPEGDVVIKATGLQWFWNYEYVDEGIAFDSYMIDGAYRIFDEANGWGDDQPMSEPQVLNDVARMKLEYFGYSEDEFLLATDTAIVIPTGQVVVVQVTGADVIHSWTIPAFGVKQDGVPGRLAELWFEVDEGAEGVYFGQCSELCGFAHAYMPITVKAVTQEQYQAWLAETKVAQGIVDDTVQVAQAD